MDDKNPRDNNGVTALHNAAENGHLEVCKIILVNTAFKIPAARDGYTPLHLAVKNGHLEICEIMVAHTVDKNPAAIDGCTPLHLAVKNGHFQVCKLLLDTGINKHPVYNGETPLQLALIDMRFRIALLFAENRRDVAFMLFVPEGKILFFIVCLFIAIMFVILMYHNILHDWK